MSGDAWLQRRQLAGEVAEHYRLGACPPEQLATVEAEIFRDPDGWLHSHPFGLWFRGRLLHPILWLGNFHVERTQSSWRATLQGSYREDHAAIELLLGPAGLTTPFTLVVAQAAVSEVFGRMQMTAGMFKPSMRHNEITTWPTEPPPLAPHAQPAALPPGPEVLPPAKAARNRKKMTSEERDALDAYRAREEVPVSGERQFADYTYLCELELNHVAAQALDVQDH